jgi:glycosyltransferase involved in cell wall biosynthesis
VVTVHHDLRDDRGWLAAQYFLPRYREAAIVHCLNTAQRTLLIQNGVSQTRVIPHGVDRRVFPAPERPRQTRSDRLRLGLVSKRYPSGFKGEGLFVALLAELDPRRVSFVLVGRGRAHEAQVARAYGFEAVCWEQLPYRLFGEIYAQMDALLIVSRFEGGPGCLPEALGSGVPVICTPVGMCPDFVHHGVNGIFLAGRSKPDGETIMALLDGDGRAMAALNEGAFGSAATIPSWEGVMAEWDQLYCSVSAAAPRRTACLHPLRCTPRHRVRSRPRAPC